MRLDDLWLDDELAAYGQQFNVELLRSLRAHAVATYSDLEAAITLARFARDQFERYGSGGSPELTDAQSREVVRTLGSLCDRLGIPTNFPFRDFSGFKSYWVANRGYGSYGARREMVQQIFGPVLEELERRENDALKGELSEPISPLGRTSWDAVDAEIAELRRHFHTARTPQDYRNIGNDVVAVLEALSAACYDPSRHLRAGEMEPAVAQTKNRLGRVIEIEFAAEGSDELVRLAKASIDVAQAVKHNPAGSRVRAGIAADAVIQLANIVRRMRAPAEPFVREMPEVKSQMPDKARGVAR